MITDLQIQRMQPLSKRQTVALKDGSGLSLRIEPKGRKTWVMRKAGKLSTLGDYPDVSLADARAAAKAATSDPTQFGEIWQLWFDEIAAHHKRPENAAKLKPLWASIMGRRVDTLKRAELVTLLRVLRARAPARAITATTQLRGVLNHALALGLIDISPLYGVPLAVVAGKPKKRTRVLSDDEISDLKEMATREGPAGAHGRFALFALATLCRRGEVGLARRSWVDDGWLKLPASAMKAARPWEVWLSDYASAQITPSNGDALFDVRPETVEHYLSQRAKVGWTLHDLRRTAASRMAQVGVLPHVISVCLAHAVGSQSDQHYITGALYLDERRAALDAWGGVLEG